jgi:hypothetical protein
MARSTLLLGISTALCAALAGWMALENRGLRDELGELRAKGEARAAEVVASPDPAEPSARPAREGRGGLAALARALSSRPATPEPAGPPGGDGPRESRGDRRARRGAEFAAIFGRTDGETEAEYRERVMPMITGMLERPRQRALEQRREAEAAAGITPEQSAKVDEALAATYGELIEYTDAAVAEGQLSPYERNVSGWLGYAGGLGGILTGTEGKIGAILKPEQMRAMYDAGFEWGEFVGVNAPWEKLRPPPPPKPE